jgi:hypothetical protein
MSVSKRQEPVLDRMVLLLAQAKYTAAALADNALDSNDPIPDDAILMLSRDLNSIRNYLHTAYEPKFSE